MIYKHATPVFKNKFFKLVKSSEKILITSHYSPDDDAIGSTLALSYILKKLYPQKTINVAITGSKKGRFSVFYGFSDIIFTQDISNIINNYDLLIGLDGSQYSRFSNFSDLINTFKGNKICIDHHASPTDKFNLHLQNSKASSTSELIYLLLPSRFKLDLQLSELFLLGILGDTGTFNYIKPGQYYVLDIVRQILEKSKIEIQEFKSRYMLISQRVYQIIQEFIANTEFKKIEGWPDFQISYLTRESISKNSYTDNEISEANEIYISQYLRIIEGHSWGINFKPYSDGSISLSLRSLPRSISVRNLVEKMGIGGGHDRASGGKIKPDHGTVTHQQAIDQVLKWLKENKPVIN